jgi:hypothetical protein
MLTRPLVRTIGIVAIATAAVITSACSSGDTTPTRYADPVTHTSKPASAQAGQQSAQPSTTLPGGPNAPDAPPMPVGDGLRSSEAGLTFTPSTTALSQGGTSFSFRIMGTDGKAFTKFAPEHTQLMHLYLIRSDLTGFQHLHPAMAGEGTWSVSLESLQPGSYRAYVAFVAVSGGGDQAFLVLGAKLTVAGTAVTSTLPAPATTAQVDGYMVTLGGPVPASGTTGNITFTITKAGVPVTDLQPYLGSYAQLAAVHDGDLAFSYPQPLGDSSAGHGGPTLGFAAAPGEAGNWRLFLQFQAAGGVHTAEITVTVG